MTLLSPYTLPQHPTHHLQSPLIHPLCIYTEFSVKHRTTHCKLTQPLTNSTCPFHMKKYRPAANKIPVTNPKNNAIQMNRLNRFRVNEYISSIAVTPPLRGTSKAGHFSLYYNLKCSTLVLFQQKQKKRRSLSSPLIL